jgi:hypothetical protein
MKSIAQLLSRALILVGFSLLGVGSVFAQQNDQLLGKMAAKLAAMPLQGIKDCGILIENLDEVAIRGGLNERNLQREVSAKLDAIGLRAGDANAFSNPYIYVNVLVDKIPRAGYAFSVSLELTEQVIPVRDKAILFSGVTWRHKALNTAGLDNLSSKVSQALSVLLDEFRRDYVSVNSQ